MQVTAINSAVLAGQGAGGSFSVGAPNPAPPQGPAAGEPIMFPDAGSGPSAAASAGATMPATYPLSGDSNEPASQYDTIKPIPKG